MTHAVKHVFSKLLITCLYWRELLHLSSKNDYLQAYDLWNVVKTDREPPPLRANPTIAQIRQHSDECAKQYKAM
ncbi:hypothetical protein CXB51_004280 [Gossypium anomalum]|uniref:Uncharacterized protein n=1 Tax=Gossypium anomalum TaxID=47600 RepID=A0A8J5ZER5_9ROSI|nr:hypothetical protein CXB51_004280 [Gossypium anomalum]